LAKSEVPWNVDFHESSVTFKRLAALRRRGTVVLSGDGIDGSQLEIFSRQMAAVFLSMYNGERAPEYWLGRAIPTLVLPVGPLSLSTRAVRE
jgi:hypothetical protein